jgi:O-antigen/teichoic acid export membrane protein
VIFALFGVAAGFLNITGHENQVVKVFTLSALLGILLGFVLIPDQGSKGAALAFFASKAFLGLGLGWALLRHQGLRSGVFIFHRLWSKHLR